MQKILRRDLPHGQLENGWTCASDRIKKGSSRDQLILPPQETRCFHFQYNETNCGEAYCIAPMSYQKHGGSCDSCAAKSVQKHSEVQPVQ